MVTNKAFILAAGLGTRMKPLTDKNPKPMMEVAGKSLIDRTIDHLRAANVNDITINTHHLANVLEDHLATYNSPKIHIAHEDKLLDTGGGIKAMRNNFGDDPFYVLSGDGLWSDGNNDSALKQLANAWDDEKMDILMLLQPISNMKITKGIGDYHLEADGRALRSYDQTGDYMFTSIRINSPRIFRSTPETPFSYLTMMDNAQKRGRLFGLVHDGDWHHLSTPEDLKAVNQVFKDD